MQSRETRAIVVALIGWLAWQAAASAQTVSETLIAFGAGRIGTWATEYYLANPSPASISVYLGNTPEVSTVCPPLTECTNFAISIPISANGSAKSPGPATGFGTMHLKATDSSSAPVVRARILNTANPSQSADLPVFRLATLLAKNPAQLVFPGVTRSESVHANLILAVLRPPDDFTPRSANVMVEAFASSGQLLASRNLNLEGGQPVFLIDLLGDLGVASLDQGQLRVTKTGGNGVIWGVMPTLSVEGTVSLGLGVNP